MAKMVFKTISGGKSGDNKVSIKQHKSFRKARLYKILFYVSLMLNVIFVIKSII